ncbi:MAG: UDP-N-acetylmuramoylalanyl-D-glutamyl-2,6-diaminopimelate/D-alanyl-D-alanyl ligase [Firmicutes bacterium]|nr:UDP-N-acetylmuramoylalanyl-D-glutamyl-2,6-diaminopimelate/D-alanyl-D-alanyl ligase [Bacillota bacterium]
MASFTVAEVLAVTQTLLDGAVFQETFSGVSTDTRTLEPGNLFIALSGDRFDGHRFLKQAAKAGAAGVLISMTAALQDLPAGITVFRAADTLAAFQGLAKFHRQRYTIPVVAITGSNGKTTTKDLTAAILASRWRVLKTEANYNNEIGLPKTLLSLASEHQAAVLEMGMRGTGQIRALCEIAAPTIGIITNVSETHIELLGSLENIAKAKRELVESIPASGTVILNADNSYVSAMREQAVGHVVTYGLGLDADVRAEQIETGQETTKFVCHTQQGEFAVVLPAIGRHNVYNALAAIAAGLAMGLVPQEIQAGISSFATTAMRLHKIAVGGCTILNDTYNASPASMAAAIDALVSIAVGRRVAVLADMLELGDIAISAHRQIGEKLANEKIDVLVTVGELAKHIAAAAKEKGLVGAVACSDHAAAQRELNRLLKPGDTILVKGSRGMKMEQIVDYLSNISTGTAS